MNQKLRQTFITWLVVYPMITGLLILLEPVVSSWALPFRTLLLSAIMVPLMVFWAMPRATTHFTRIFGNNAVKSAE